MGSRQEGITRGITDAWTISQRPNTNGYTLSDYLDIKARYESFIFADMTNRATPYQLSYLDGFDAVAVKRGFIDVEFTDDL